jgi:hypothetical protein
MLTGCVFMNIQGYAGAFPALFLCRSPFKLQQQVLDSPDSPRSGRFLSPPERRVADGPHANWASNVEHCILTGCRSGATLCALRASRTPTQSPRRLSALRHPVRGSAPSAVGPRLATEDTETEPSPEYALTTRSHVRLDLSKTLRLILNSYPPRASPRGLAGGSSL